MSNHEVEVLFNAIHSSEEDAAAQDQKYTAEYPPDQTCLQHI